ncbi:hypothetical protein [Anaplasma marginale]|uniref:hypothetical protein n=1 Tax=Anaplasma marginale TaxID=770 RepID=UPI0009B6D9AC|nr:hypothetical protein [Anaplasma marginale]
MVESKKSQNPVVVDLAKDILVSTNIPKVNHAALRSGFAGYPPNPRWNTAKYLAWKTGSKLRKALAEGQMRVRSRDCMLVPVGIQEEKPIEELSHSPFFFLFDRAKQLLPN